MELLKDLFFHQPTTILVVAGFFFVAHVVFKRFSASNDAPLLVPAVGWAVYGVWEFAMMKWAPAANPPADIRFDLLLIWPILLVLSIWFAIQAFRSV